MSKGNQGKNWDRGSRVGLLLLAGIGVSAPAEAADGTPEVNTTPEVVVSANRLPTPADEVASSFSVITGEQIEQHQDRSLPDALRDLPGLYIAESGGPGHSSRLFMRGTESRHTLVLIDGIEVQDPSSPDGAFEFQHLLVGDLSRVEVLRGPQSTLYGASAIGGVVDIVTRPGSGPAKVAFTAEGGSFDTLNQTARVSGSSGRFNYAFDAQHYYTGGVDITPKRLRPVGSVREADGYDNETLSTKLGAEVTDNFGLSLVGRYINSRADTDVNPEDPNSLERQQQFYGRVQGNLSLFDGRFEQKLGLNYTRYDRVDTDRADGFSNSNSDEHDLGTRVKADWQGDVYVTDTQVITGGLESKREAADTASNFSSGFASQTSNSTSTNSGYLQLKSSFFDRLYNTIGIRLDHNDRFGSETTWRLAPALLIHETGTKLKATYGTGFWAPTLFELFGTSQFLGFPIFQGNPNLQPEESKGWDAGFEETLWQKRISFGSTYFHNEITNLIAFNDSFTSEINKPSARTYGFESFVAVKPIDGVTLRFDHTFTIAKDGETGGELLRRPKHKAALSGDWQATDKLAFSASLLYIGERVDVDPVSFVNTRVGGYTVVNVAAGYVVNDTWKLFGRIDNLLNKSYDDPDGFQRPGFGAFVGAKAVF